MGTFARVTATAALIMSYGAGAQEMDSFDLDNFIDPRDLGALMTTHGKTVPGTEFELMTTSAGWVANYQDRDTFTRQDREFASIAYSRYWSDWQADATLTVLDHQLGATTWRVRTDVGKYYLVESTSNSRLDFMARTALTLVVDNFLENRGPSYELSWSNTVQTISLLPEALRITGSGTLSYRHSQEGNTVRGIYTTGSDLPQPQFLGGRVRFNVALWFGYETVGGQGRILPVKGRGLVDYYFTDRAAVELSYGPAYQFASAGIPRGFNNEWVAMLLWNVYRARH
jgi:hypothetical protein